MLITALAKEIGYDKAAEIAQEAQKTGEPVIAVAARKTKIAKKKLERMLDAGRMV